MEQSVLDITTREDFRDWLANNAATARACYVAVRRGRPKDDGGFYYLDAVEEALCFGWIDSTVRKIDGRVMQRFSPRKKNSPWSELNKARVRRLEALGRMTARGRAVLPPMGKRSFQIDPAIVRALKDARLWTAFRAFPPLYQRVRAYNIAFYKRRDPAKFKQSLQHLIAQTKQGRLYGDWNDYGRLPDDDFALQGQTRMDPQIQTPGLNPFLPFSVYIPDGEPKVFGDRLYLYGSFDRFGGGYCSKVYRTASAPLCDLTDWTVHGESFSSLQVPWSDAELYAPDVLAYGGQYYLFFCMSDGSEGVAQSDRPQGPFHTPRRITCGGVPITGIDPSVLAHDGKIYYTWGQFHLQMGELADDLCTLKPETVHTDVLSNAPGREGFHEGSSLRRIGNKFCLIYASEYTAAYPNSGGRPTKLDYAVADTPYGPYTRRGTVIDNTGCDPASWNNHGSVICAGGQWYVFYHASSANTRFARRARVERLQVVEQSADIVQAEPTTGGFLPAVLPQQIRSPVHACRFFGGAFVTETADGRFPAVGLQNGAGFSFRPVCFSGEPYTVRLRCRVLRPLTLHLRCPGAQAQICLQPASAAQTAVLQFCPAAGEQQVTVDVSGAPDAALCEIDALRFNCAADD